MKKIINGKTYNTETAELLGEWRNGDDSSNIHYIEEGLYRTSKGALFLAGQGGAYTDYAEHSSDGCFSGGRRITPMSEEKAKSWAEEHLTADEYIEAFGEPEEA